MQRVRENSVIEARKAQAIEILAEEAGVSVEEMTPRIECVMRENVERISVFDKRRPIMKRGEIVSYRSVTIPI